MSVLSSFDTPIMGPIVEISDAWLDEGVLGWGHHAGLFDTAIATALDILDAREAYRRSMGRGFMISKAHCERIKQVPAGSKVRATFRLVDFDERSLHVYLELYHLDGWLAAISENQMLHVDLATGMPVPIVGELAQDLATMLRYHRSLPPTKYMGRKVTVLGATT